MENFFHPSENLAKRMGKYHGEFSPARLDLTPTRMPVWGSRISVKCVQESVSLRIWRYFGTLGRSAGALIPIANTIIIQSKFSSEFADDLRDRFNFNQDPASDVLMNDLAKEFVEWLRSIGGKYSEHPTVEDIILIDDNSVELQF
ncbi:MAG: hypothetical protein HY226_04310 [Candidatus Vogelbacteria bacterium]|nr:hypothetical protein [Candidatus Vogelbacteria bacterium]